MVQYFAELAAHCRFQFAVTRHRFLCQTIAERVVLSTRRQHLKIKLGSRCCSLLFRVASPTQRKTVIAGACERLLISGWNPANARPVASLSPPLSHHSCAAVADNLQSNYLDCSFNPSPEISGPPQRSTVLSLTNGFWVFVIFYY